MSPSRSPAPHRRRGRATGPDGDGAVDGRSARWDSHRVARRRQLVEAGLAVLNEVGGEFAIEQVAERAGVTRPVVYRHFTDRATLMSAMADRASEILVEQWMLPAIRADLPVRELVRRALDAYVTAVAKNPRVYRMVTRGSTRLLCWEQAVKAVIAQAIGHVLEEKIEATGQGEPIVAEIWALGLVGFAHNIVESWLDTRHVEHAVLVDTMTHLVWAQVDGFARSRGVVLDPDAHIDLADIARQSTRP